MFKKGTEPFLVQKGLRPLFDTASLPEYTSRMPRVARAVVDGIPYHVTQRGNRGQDVFFADDDRRAYMSYLRDYSERYALDVLAYCLMTNHVHLVVLPREPDSLALTLRSAHMRYSQMINARFGWTGHLWQGRYFSVALDEPHLWAAVRYVERNPVRARVVREARDYKWSSAGFHLGLRTDRLVRSSTEWGSSVEDWSSALAAEQDQETIDLLRSRTQSGFPCGDEAFVRAISDRIGRPLLLRGRGRPRRA